MVDPPRRTPSSAPNQRKSRPRKLQVFFLFMIFVSGFLIARVADEHFYKKLMLDSPIHLSSNDTRGTQNTPFTSHGSESKKKRLESASKSEKMEQRANKYQKSVDTTQRFVKSSVWPSTTPRQLFGENFDNCQVVFRDSSMATCHYGAFGGNFGDMLGPDIVKRIVEYRFGCTAKNLSVVDFSLTNVTKGPCLWTVGSVWREVRKHDHVWGTGSFGKPREFTQGPCKGGFNNVTVYSLRGPRSKEMLRDYCRKRVQVLADFGYTVNVSHLRPHGDGGFMIPFMFPEIGPTDHHSAVAMESCVILHKYDQDTFTNFEALGNFSTLLPVIQPWQTMAGNISRCKVVSSSSLHGLILADAYGVPSRWVKRSPHILPFKFRDYYDSLGLLSKKRVPLINVLANNSLEIPEALDFQWRSDYAKKVIHSFPFHLFTSTNGTRPTKPDIETVLIKPINGQTTKPARPVEQEKVQADYSIWPSKTPRQLFGDKFDQCQVLFRDSAMATCHLGAFGGNFGDMLGPDIVKRILEYRFGCSAQDLWVHDFKWKTTHAGPCLWTVGSVWRDVRVDDHVWGTGSFGKSSEFQHSVCRGYGERFNNVTIYSVRGPKTQQLIETTCTYRMQVYADHRYTKNLSKIPAYGDAGFLVPFIFPELRRNESSSSEDRLEECVVLHWYDEETFANYTQQKAVDNTATYLPVVQPWATMAGNMSRCQVVSSSSLHGVILADSYGIPARWIRKEHSVAPFKFLDYFESVGHIRTVQKFDEVLLGQADSLIPAPIPKDHRSAYAKKILDTFPFHLFESKMLSS